MGNLIPETFSHFTPKPQERAPIASESIAINPAQSIEADKKASIHAKHELIERLDVQHF